MRACWDGGASPNPGPSAAGITVAAVWTVVDAKLSDDASELEPSEQAATDTTTADSSVAKSRPGFVADPFLTIIRSRWYLGEGSSWGAEVAGAKLLLDLFEGALLTGFFDSIRPTKPGDKIVDASSEPLQETDLDNEDLVDAVVFSKFRNSVGGFPISSSRIRESVGREILRS